MENKIIVANMKMYMNIDDVKEYLNNFEDKLLNNVIMCPSNIYIPYFLEKNMIVGIQNVYYEDNGAYTGEVSVEQIKNIGVKYVIVGHSERRQWFSESDYDINKKLVKVLDNGLNVILCIGETLEERNSLKTLDVLREQLEIDLNNISNKSVDSIIVAYEPRWAIGTGIVPSNNDIEEVIDYIKSYMLDKYKNNIKVLYGGSVSDSNINILNKISNVDGFMIGSACTKSNKMLSILNSCDNI